MSCEGQKWHWIVTTACCRLRRATRWSRRLNSAWSRATRTASPPSRKSISVPPNLLPSSRESSFKLFRDHSLPFCLINVRFLELRKDEFFAVSGFEPVLTDPRSSLVVSSTTFRVFLIRASNGVEIHLTFCPSAVALKKSFEEVVFKQLFQFGCGGGLVDSILVF